MKLNHSISHDPIFTHEGAPAVRIAPEQALRRSVLSCLLWEKEFYEAGQTIADRIEALAAQVKPETLAALAVEARHKAHLRHAPLLLLTALIQHGKGVMVADAIEATISRADELPELLAVYWRKGKRPLSAQLKKGLARAFLKFDEYALAKYNRDAAIKLRDVLFLSHAKPDTPERDALWKRLKDNQLATPDTWEVSLSAAGNNRETWERLIREGKLGYLALLRNLRNMSDAGCDEDLIGNAIIARKGGADKVLPFRFIAAARECPRFEPALDIALCENIASMPRLHGRTVVLVDVSDSMNAKLSEKSKMSRMDAGAALASVIHGDLRVFSFSHHLIEVPPRRGMAGVDAIKSSQPHGGTWIGQAVRGINDTVPHDRLIVITDEQSHDPVPAPTVKNAYMINVASAQNAIGYGPWKRIHGFSENVIRWIIEHENQD